MQRNIVRIKRELDTIDSEHYYKHTTKNQLQALYDTFDKFYTDLEKMYNKDQSEVKWDPNLSNYIYHVTLRFHSAMYISKGRSTHPAVNPRYMIMGAKPSTGMLSKIGATMGVTKAIEFNKLDAANKYFKVLLN